jgi:hypothetical protein
MAINQLSLYANTLLVWAKHIIWLFILTNDLFRFAWSAYQTTAH